MDRQPISEAFKPEVATATVAHSPTIDSPVLLGDVPIDVLRHFDVDHRTMVEGDKSKLNDIYKWAAQDLFEATPGNIMQEISRIQTKLGGDRTPSKVWNWLRVKQSIGDMRKKQQAMENGYANIWSA